MYLIFCNKQNICLLRKASIRISKSSFCFSTNVQYSDSLVTYTCIADIHVDMISLSWLMKLWWIHYHGIIMIYITLSAFWLNCATAASFFGCKMAALALVTTGAIPEWRDKHVCVLYMYMYYMYMTVYSLHVYMYNVHVYSQVTN